MSSKKSPTSDETTICRASATSRSVITMNCPSCGTPTVYSNSNPNRPFCSRNCKINDLSAWASDEYRVPETTQNTRPQDAGMASNDDDERY